MSPPHVNQSLLSRLACDRYSPCLPSFLEGRKTVPGCVCLTSQGTLLLMHAMVPDLPLESSVRWADMHDACVPTARNGYLDGTWLKPVRILMAL